VTTLWVDNNSSRGFHGESNGDSRRPQCDPLGGFREYLRLLFSPIPHPPGPLAQPMHHCLLPRRPMERDSLIDPEDVNSAPTTPDTTDSRDTADDIPVPIAMSAAEIDERAQAVQAQGGTPAEITDEELQP